jgi:cytosine/adenosine deaminase-related metal-dependent hydrolase
MIEGMRRTLRYMMNTGTFAFADFREGGGAGIDLMLEAQKGMPLTSRILGRPIDGSIDMHELCWGLGISSARDYDIKRLEEMVDLARAGHKVIAIHAGEAGRDDISSALSLGPDFLVHLCNAYGEDLQRIAALDLPVVVCPRSNLMTGAGLPDVKRMVDLGMTVGVGTDNVMLNSPNIFREMEILSKAILHDDGQVFKMCTLNGAKILGIDKTTGSISEGKDGRVMVIDMRSNNLWGSANPLASLVRRAEPSDILAVF